MIIVLSRRYHLALMFGYTVPTGTRYWGLGDDVLFFGVRRTQRVRTYMWQFGVFVRGLNQPAPDPPAPVQNNAGR
jgi:hypothetical protein